MKVTVNYLESFVEVQGIKKKLGEGLIAFPTIEKYVEVYRFQAPQRPVTQVTVYDMKRIGLTKYPDLTSGEVINADNLKVCYQ